MTDIPSRLPAETADVSYEIDLDDEPPHTQPVLVDPPEPEVTRRPLVPPQPITVMRREIGLACYRAAWHGLRSPRYLLLAAGWSVVGLVQLLGAHAAWWSVQDGRSIKRDARKAKDDKAWSRAHEQVRATAKVRSYITLAVTVTVLVAADLAWRYGHWLVLLPLLVIMPLLARYGRPDGQPIITPAVVTPRWRKMNADVVLRAYYAAGLGHPDKPGMQVTFGSTMAREGQGSRVEVDLPYGLGLDDAVKARSKIASGLDVTESQVFIRRDPTSHRRHTLWVADRDPLAVPVGRTPLLACRATDIWRDAPLGLDERGQMVTVPLLWHSLLVGGMPRQGKSWTSRQLALFAALDPHVQLDVFDAGGKPDWRRFALVADSCGFGLTPTRDGKPPEILLDTLLRLRADVEERYARLSAMPTSVCPEGKLTRAIARDPRYRMPVRLLALGEVQEYFLLGEISKPIAELLVYLVKVAPGAGVIVLSDTQRPSGIGTGLIQTQFVNFRDQHQVRFALKTPSWGVSDLVLGDGAYSAGLDSSALLPEYKGVGILRGVQDANPVTRCYYCDDQDAETILHAARKLRERAGTLSGMAAGETVQRDRRDVLGDVLAVFGGEPGLHWRTVAERLAARFPDRWADVTAEAVSEQCRALGVPSVVVTATGERQRGCRLRDVQEAAAR